MCLICPNCGEGESIFFHDEGEDSLPDGFYCEYCYYKMGEFIPA